MSRRLEPLTGDVLDELPDPCHVCLFWELGHARPGPGTPTADVDELAADPAVQKQAWCAEQVLEGMPPGRAVRVDGKVVAYGLFAPPGVFARRRPPAPQPSRDAVLLATVWVDRFARDEGLGRLLVEAAVKEAIRLQLAAVEVYGDRRYREGTCVLPVTWLLSRGFEIFREHPRYPLLRLDVRRTARWADTLEHAIEGVLERTRARLPLPAKDVVATTQRHSG